VYDSVRSVEGNSTNRAGFEFIVPLARWKGFGGGTDVRTLCFETFTFAAALGARREESRATLSTPPAALHPVNAARVTVQYVRQAIEQALETIALFCSGDFCGSRRDAGRLREHRGR
jgi:dimethylsulfone monooxygenase